MAKAIGHEVRVNCLYAGAEDLALETGDEAIFKTVRKVDDDVIDHKLFITGATGSALRWRFAERARAQRQSRIRDRQSAIPG
jgi:DUF1680 family protein